MALTHSESIPMGTPAKPFVLPGIDGRSYSLEQFVHHKVLVVMFICKHCPYVVAVQDRLASLANHFAGKSVQFIGINSNDSTRYPDDGLEGMVAQAQAVGFSFPYLIDATQEVARAYGAVCTPDIFVFHRAGGSTSQPILGYHGRIDDSWKDPAKVTQEDLKTAIEGFLIGKPFQGEQIPSMGCSIKWKQN